MPARQYQTEVVRAIAESYESGNTSPLVVAATGVGKNFIACKTITDVFDGPTMFLAHRSELIHQFCNACACWVGQRPGVEMGEWHTWGSAFDKPPIVASTIQTQLAGRGGLARMHKFDRIRNLIIDEAHHATSPSYRRVIDFYRSRYKGLRVLGLTATPDRADKRAMGLVFDDVAYNYDIKSAIKDGWLVDIKQRLFRINSLDFNKVKVTAGDLNGKQLATVMEYERHIHSVVKPTIEAAGDKPAIVYGVTISHAERMAEVFNRYKPGSARAVSSKTPRVDREQLNVEFGSGRFQFLCNCGTHTEGYDNPLIQVVVMARPTLSRSLYTQCVGRGTRPLPGLIDSLEDAQDRCDAIASSHKPHVEVYDFVGNATRHKLMSTVDILGGLEDDEVNIRAKKIISDSGEAAVPAEAIEQAEEELAAEREAKKEEEEKKRANIVATVDWSTKQVNPFNALDLNPNQSSSAPGQPASTKQVMLLSKFGIDARQLDTKQASRAIGKVFKRNNSGMSSPKQIDLLSKYGVDAREMSRKEASGEIDRIKARGWRRT
tara:strand:+ start:342 stop:1982 length:1641 start_codon:yes stop_codon:yes gene_type:complete